MHKFRLFLIYLPFRAIWVVTNPGIETLFAIHHAEGSTNPGQTPPANPPKARRQPYARLNALFCDHLFIGREHELRTLREQSVSPTRTAVLVYGKRRVGKPTLIAEAAKTFDGTVVEHLCVQSTFEGNLALLYRSVSQAFGLPPMQFGHLYDLFDFFEVQDREILIMLDEYQHLKESLRGSEVDSLFQTIIDRLPPQVKLVLCGSYITVMKECAPRGSRSIADSKPSTTS